MISVSDKVSILRHAFGAVELSRDKINVAVKCPNCGKSNSSKKKLVIRLDDGRYHCWVCGLRGKGLAYFFRRYKPRYSHPASEIFEKKLADKKEEELPPIQLPENF